MEILSNFREISRLNNFCLDNKGVDFRPNITPIEVIKKGAFGGTYFRNIYSSVNGKWHRKTWKEFDVLKDIDQKYYCTNYYDASVKVLIFLLC